MMSSTAVPRWLSAALSSVSTWRGSPAKERATKPQSAISASRQTSIGGSSFSPAYFELLALVRRRRELALGQAIDAVVLDDVDHRHVAAHHVLELAEADAAGIAVAADADRLQRVVGQQRAGGHRGHAAVQAVEAVRLVQEVGGRLAGAADAAQLDDLRRLDREVIGDGDDARGDRVVAAALAERRGAALVVVAASGRSGSYPGLRWFLNCHSLALLFHDGLGDPASGQRQAIALCARGVSLPASFGASVRRIFAICPSKLFSTT